MRWCSAARHSIMVKFHGSVVPDSQFQGEYGNLYRQSLAEMWNGQVWRDVRAQAERNEAPTACAQCAIKEQRFGHSRRQFFRDLLDPMLPASPEPTDGPDIYFLEINTSNLCNLKCVMCNGRTSTAWIKDEYRLADLPAGLLREDIRKAKHRTHDGATLLTNLFAERHHFRNLRYLSLKGGEPFLDPLNREILEWLVREADPAAMTVDLTTNGTVPFDDWWPVLNRFGTVKLHLSVEATGDLYRFVRGGNHTLDTVIQHARSWPAHAQVIWVYLLMAYNVEETPAVIDTYLANRQPNWTFNLKNIVVNPKYLSPGVVNTEVRSRAADALVSYVGCDKSVYGVENIINCLRDPACDDEARREFIEFTRDLVYVRGNGDLIHGLVERLLPEMA